MGRDRSAPGDKNESLRELALSLSSSIGSKFFRGLVDELCRILSCDFALVGELLPGLPERVRTIAASRKGIEIPDFEYGLEFSPCANVMGQTLRSYARGIQALFPKDAFLSEFGIEGYLGIPLFDSASSAIGLVVVLYERPVEDVPRAESVLQIFASRASAELDWLRKDRALQASENRYRALFERNVAGVFRSTLEGEILEINDAFVRMFGYSSAEELKAASASSLYPCPEARAPFLDHLKKERVLLGYECELRRKDGTTGWTVENVALVHDETLGREVLQGTIIDVTALKNAERALRESERQLRHAAKSAQLGYWHWDAVSDRVSWSEEELAIFGLTRDEWTPTFAGYLERLHPDDVGVVRDAVAEASRVGGPMTYEVRIVRPNGEVRHLHTTIESTRDNTGRAVEMFGTTLDLTDRVQAEQARRASEQAYRELFETSRDGIVYMDLTGQIIHHNSAYARMLGYENGGLQDLCCKGITPRKWHALQAEIIEREVLTKGESNEYEKEYVRRDGSVFPVSLRTWLRRDEAGEPAGFWTIARDISDRRRAEAAHQESEARFRSLADSLPDGMFVNVNGRFAYANPAMLHLLGARDFAELADVPVMSIVHPDYHQIVHERRQTIFCHGGGVPPLEEVYLRLDGTPVHVEVSASECKYSSERAVQVVVRDITERRRFEVAARRREMELAHVGRLAVLGEMAAGLTHELNQPLTAIANYINGSTRRLRESGTTNAAILNVMERAAAEALRAGEIVGSLREFIRRDNPVRRPLSVSQIVEDAVRLLRAESRHRETVISTDLATSLPTVWVDGIQIEQVLANLLRNAMEAMQPLPEAERRITVGTYRADTGRVGVYVRDTGPGVAPELVDRIFESFVTTKPDGLGMGLSICRRIVQAHGGELWVESGESGAEFRFTLPIAQGEGPFP